jgi:predicted Zn-dependent protease
MTVKSPPNSTGVRCCHRSRIALVVFWIAGSFAVCGCEGPGDEGVESRSGRGEGPGHRAQVLALSPQQELQMGRRAYREILSNPAQFGSVLPSDAPETERVRKVAERIIAAAGIEPLEREMNLHPGRFDWEICVLDSPKINAFCLPGGKMAVFLGLLRIVQNDDQLAAVISHETAHALAHHVSERVAQSEAGGSALAMLRGKAFDREQEAEADHIGVFLMTFAGYNPEEAVRLWENMERLSEGQLHLPEILSDHPSDARRLRNIASWVPRALAAKRAFDEGRIEPAHARRGGGSGLAVFEAVGQASRRRRLFPHFTRLCFLLLLPQERNVGWDKLAERATAHHCH